MGGEKEGDVKLIDLRGVQCGELLVVERVATPLLNGVWWRCACECGGEVIKESRWLRECQCPDAFASCDTCSDELRAGKRLDAQHYIKEAYRERWERHGHLWGWMQVRDMMDDIWQALEREYGEIEDTPSMPMLTLYLLSSADYARKNARASTERMATKRAMSGEYDEDGPGRRSPKQWAEYRRKARSEIAFLNEERMATEKAKRVETLLSKERNMRTRETVMRKAKELRTMLEAS